MQEIDKFQPTPTRSILDRLPVIGLRRELRRQAQAEDLLEGQVIAKLMGHLTDNGFTETYLLERELLLPGERPVDMDGSTQKQIVFLKGGDGKSFKVKLESDQGTEDAKITHNLLSLSVSDHIKEGQQRFLAFYKSQFLPSSWGRKKEEYIGREFYGVMIKDWGYDNWFDLPSDAYKPLLNEILGSEVDIEATLRSYELANSELQADHSVMKSVVWNKPPRARLN